MAIVPGHNLCGPAGFFPVPMTTQHGQSVSNGSFVPVTVHGYPGEPMQTTSDIECLIPDLLLECFDSLLALVRERVRSFLSSEYAYVYCKGSVVGPLRVPICPLEKSFRPCIN